MKLLKFQFLVALTVASSIIRAADLCEYVRFTPEAFQISLLSLLPQNGVHILPSASPFFPPASSYAMVRDDGAVGTVRFEEDPLEGRVSLTIADNKGLPLFEVAEKTYPCPYPNPNQMCQRVDYSSRFSPQVKDQATFTIEQGDKGVEHFHFGEPRMALLWRSDLDFEVSRLMRHLQSTRNVIALPEEKDPARAFSNTLWLNETVAPFVPYLAVTYRSNTLKIKGRITYFAYGEIVNLASANHYFRLDLGQLIVDSASRPPEPASLRVRTACGW